MKKGKRIWNKILSLMLCLVMVTGMFAGMGMEAEAAENVVHDVDNKEGTTGAQVLVYVAKLGEGTDGITTDTPSYPGTIKLYPEDSGYDYQILSNGGNYQYGKISRIEVSDDYDFGRIWIPGESGAQWKILLIPNGTLNVTVKEDGNVLSGQRVEVEGLGSKQTDSAGRVTFKVRNIWENTVVKTTKDGYTYRKTISDSFGTGTREVEINITSPKDFTVVLQDETGNPIKGAEITASTYNAEGTRISMGDSDNNGTYIGKLRDGLVYSLIFKNSLKGFSLNDAYPNINTGEIYISTAFTPDVNTRQYTVTATLNTPSVSPTNINMTAGDTTNIVVYSSTDTKNGVSYSWSVEDSTIVSLRGTEQKTVTALKAGTTNIIYSASHGTNIKSVTIPVTVNKKDPILNVTVPGFSYGKCDGNIIVNSDVAGTFTIGERTVTVLAGSDTEIEANPLIGASEAGTHSINYTFVPSDESVYNRKSGTASYTVEAIDLSNAAVSYGNDDMFVYDGTEQQLGVVSVTMGDRVLQPEIDYNVFYENNVNAGINTAIVRISGINNYKGEISRSYSVAKAPLSVVDVTAENKTYNGNETVKISGVGLNGIASADNIENVIDLTNATAEVSDRHVGSYDHVSMLNEIQLTNANYELNLPTNGFQIPLTGPVSITKCPVTVEGVVIDPSKVYDGTTRAEISNMGSLTKNFDGEKLSLIPGVANYTDKNVGTEKVVTFTEFKLYGGEELIANYELTQPAPQTASITKKPLNMVDGTVAIKDKFYDGTKTASFVDKPTLVADDIITGDQVVLDYVTQSPEFKSIGSADAENEVEVIANLTITGLDAGNYELKIPKVTAFITNYAAVKGTDYVVNSNDWINGDFTITAAGGCLLSEGSEKDSEWTNTLIVSCNENESNIGTKAFYVKRGNGTISKVVSENYLMEKVAPTGTVKFRDAESTWSKFVQNITFGLLFKDAQEIIITAVDQEGLSGIKKVEWYEYNPVDDKGLSLEELNGISQLSWKNYKEEMKPIVSLKDTKKFVYYVKITDNAGNISYISTDGAVYDATNPTVAGVKDGTTCYASQKVTVTDTNLVSVTLNDVPVVITDRASIELEGNKNATYTIVATDKAGNETIVTVTMKPITALSDQIKDITEGNVSTSHKSLLKNIQNVIAKENIENATAEEKEELLELSSKCIPLLNKIEAIEKAAREKAKREEEARLQAEREKAEKEQAAREWAAAQAEKAERERLAALEEAALKASKQKKETETLTVPVSGEENTVHADVTIKEGAVYIQPLDEKELEHILGEHVETGVVEVDLTVLEDEIKEVNLPVETLLSIVEAAEHAHNDTEALAIHLSTGTILIDDQTMRAVVEAAHGETIHLVLDDDSEHRLNDNQRNAIKDHDVHGHMEAYFVCTQSNRRISNFEGGMATLSKEFHVPEGYHPAGFTVWYVADDGSMEELETWYENGNLVWKVGHFSDFVIIYDEAAAVESENAETTDAADVIIETSVEEVEKTVGFPWWIVAAVVVIAGVAAFVVKAKNKKEDEKA